MVKKETSKSKQPSECEEGLKYLTFLWKNVERRLKKDKKQCNNNLSRYVFKKTLKLKYKNYTD